MKAKVADYELDVSFGVCRCPSAFRMENERPSFPFTLYDRRKN
ncbi:hypothetical protein [Prevotella sp. HUN102]|nr:hypothetical protein [Prevotella sp. HUN102]